MIMYYSHHKFLNVSYNIRRMHELAFANEFFISIFHVNSGKFSAVNTSKLFGMNIRICVFFFWSQMIENFLMFECFLPIIVSKLVRIQ